ncbi:MAG: hypothetical protein IT177_05260 [Acidobacteria bacterium]|nr:hypothetical protein [Acidobacteriota bacterium]
MAGNIRSIADIGGLEAGAATGQSFSKAAEGTARAEGAQAALRTGLTVRDDDDPVVTCADGLPDQ